MSDDIKLATLPSGPNINLEELSANSNIIVPLPWEHWKSPPLNIAFNTLPTAQVLESDPASFMICLK